MKRSRDAQAEKGQHSSRLSVTETTAAKPCNDEQVNSNSSEPEFSKLIVVNFQ